MNESLIVVCQECRQSVWMTSDGKCPVCGVNLMEVFE